MKNQKAIDLLKRELKASDNWLHRLLKSCVIFLDDGEVTKRAIEKQSRYNNQAIAALESEPAVEPNEFVERLRKRYDGSLFSRDLDVVELCDIIGRQNRHIKLLQKPAVEPSEFTAGFRETIGRYKVGLKDESSMLDCGETACDIINRQAAIIKKQAAEIKEYRWIPVSERLPKAKGYISAADAKLQIPATWYWTNTNAEADRLKAYYTHWKPIILPK